MALKLPFERLISIDLILYGSSLLLEFVALAVRTFGAKSGATVQGGESRLCLLVGSRAGCPDWLCLYASRTKRLRVQPQHYWLALAVALLGPMLYWLTAAPLARRRLAAASAND